MYEGRIWGANEWGRAHGGGRGDGRAGPLTRKVYVGSASQIGPWPRRFASNGPSSPGAHNHDSLSNTTVSDTRTYLHINSMTCPRRGLQLPCPPGNSHTDTLPTAASVKKGRRGRSMAVSFNRTIHTAAMDASAHAVLSAAAVWHLPTIRPGSSRGTAHRRTEKISTRFPADGRVTADSSRRLLPQMPTHGDSCALLPLRRVSACHHSPPPSSAVTPTPESQPHL